jgi:4-nitrophenyl phosphatase
MKQRLSEIRALILDLDGTLLLGDRPVPGFRGFFSFLHQEHLPFIIATNNATQTPLDYIKRLEKHGARVGVEAILTAGIATVAYLQQTLPEGAPLYVIGERALLQPLAEAGFRLRQDARLPVAAVVVGGDSTLTYEKLKNAALLLQKGALLVGTNPDVAYPSEEGLVPETGTTLAALRAATGAVPVIIGKPEKHLFEQAVARLGLPAASTAVVGDRLETDIEGGKKAGLKTILTTTGVDSETTIRQKGIQPDWVVSGLDSLVEIWRIERREKNNANTKA